MSLHDLEYQMRQAEIDLDKARIADTQANTIKTLAHIRFYEKDHIPSFDQVVKAVTSNDLTLLTKENA